MADIAKRVSPAVVSIDVRSADAAGSGSGVVIDKGGYILTNNHVVNFGAKLDHPGGVLRPVLSAPAKVVGTDPRNDLAVIKVDKTALTVASLGDSSTLAVGDPVVAIGNPLGSARHRHLRHRVQPAASRCGCPARTASRTR